MVPFAAPAARGPSLAVFVRPAPSRPAKRAFDIAFSAIALVLLFPVLAVVWTTVRLHTPGPGLYWSERLGRCGRRFIMPKFRTMTVCAPRAPREDLGEQVPHVTSLGRFLRRWSLDELPQLWCVLRGEMSLVGPRPLLPEDAGQSARAAFPAAFSVRPGLSGLAQVKGRNRLTPRRKARYDAFYARTRSWPLDLMIIGRTLVVAITGKGLM